MDYTVISHDAFGRYETIRRTVKAIDSCAWCGNARWNGRLFQYGSLSDGYGSRPNWQHEAFCSVSCMRIYHNV